MTPLVAGLEHARAEFDRAEIHRLVDELLDLREQTDPAAGGDPAAVRFRVFRGKHAAAGGAIAIGSMLSRLLFGWALNHVVGRALPEAATRSADDHGNETAGIEEYCSPDGGWPGRGAETAARDRAVLRALLNGAHIQPLFPTSLAYLISEALEAFEFGEVHPIFTAPKTGRHGAPFELARWRRLALEYVYFLVGSGAKHGDAMDRVAGCFGVSSDTLKSWESRLLPTVFPKEELGSTFKDAKEGGRLFTLLRDDPDCADRGKGRTETLNGSAYWAYKRLSVGMREAGQEYQRALRGE